MHQHMFSLSFECRIYFFCVQCLHITSLVLINYFDVVSLQTVWYVKIICQTKCSNFDKCFCKYFFLTKFVTVRVSSRRKNNKHLSIIWLLKQNLTSCRMRTNRRFSIFCLFYLYFFALSITTFTSHIKYLEYYKRINKQVFILIKCGSSW